MTVVTEERELDVVYNPAQCNRCGLCLEVCPFNVWELPETGPAVMARIEDCTNCTACAKNCLGNAIVVKNYGCGCIWNQTARLLGKVKDNIVGKDEDEGCDSESSCSGSTGCCG